MTIAASALTDVASQYLDALLDGDQAGAEMVVTRARIAGVSVVDVHTRLIGPAMATVGRLWAAGELSVADEHMAAEITDAVMRRLAAREERPRGPLAVVACGPREGHVLGGRAIASALSADGWQVVYLGGCVPLTTLERLVAVRAPALVALSVKLHDGLDEIAATVRRIKALRSAPFVLVGGTGTAGSLDLAADLVEDDIGTALRRVQGLVHAAS